LQRCKKGNTALVHELPDTGSNVNLKLVNEHTHIYALHMTVFNKFEATAKLLLDKGAEVDSRHYSSKSQTGNTGLQLAVINEGRGYCTSIATPRGKFDTKVCHAHYTYHDVAYRRGGWIRGNRAFVLGERSQNLGDK
jgi:hypothetical protein